MRRKVVAQVGKFCPFDLIILLSGKPVRDFSEQASGNSESSSQKKAQKKTFTACFKPVCQKSSTLLIDIYTHIFTSNHKVGTTVGLNRRL